MQFKLKNEEFKCSFGVNRDDADVSITSVKANPFVEVHYSNITISSHLIGLNASNLYAAITIGKYFEVDENSIKEALEVIFQKIGHNY
jgi:UDP-N-acetylmuramoyl-tripeptide--D-alanyl-D-alanine ligase